MNCFLFNTVVTPQYSVFLPQAPKDAHRPIAFHQDTNGFIWAEWTGSGGKNNAYVRLGASALAVAEAEMERRRFWETSK